MTPRQQQAAAIAAELHRLGGFVLNPMPLDEAAKLRFQVLDVDREAVLEKISSWGWAPRWVASLPRVCSNGPQPALIYEIDLPRSRQPVAETRSPRGEIAERKKTAEEVAAMRKHLGLS